MCGIAGIVSGRTSIGLRERRRDIEELIEPLRHRGPDAHGVWVDPELDVGIGHRRLSIVDLSPTGAQPMVSRSDRYVVSYNGEIYNFHALRAELGHSIQWKGTSDTEVLTVLIENYGVVGALKKIDGMFAIAVWDRKDRQLFLARDRFGEKPLYFGLQSGQLIFASELGSFMRSARFDPKISTRSLPQYVRFGYYPGETCVLSDVRKLKPGYVALISYSDLKQHRLTKAADIPIEPFWNATEAFNQARSAPYKGSFEDATQELDDRLSAIVKRQVFADVPVGAFLSGGIDSSTVVALMAKHTSAAPKTFTIGYEEPDFDESKHAREIAARIGTDHNELIIKASEALDLVPKIGSLIDEPMADQSHIPTYFVSQLARRKVTVALTGDGGDELLGGYVRHSWIQRVWRYTGGGNPILRGLASGTLGMLSIDQWDRLGSFGRRYNLGPLAQAGLGFKVQKLRGSLQSRSEIEMYQRLTSQWWDLSQMFPGTGDANRYPELQTIAADPAQKAMFWDMMTYLPGNCLAKVDRASMSHSLETRTPFLDHKLAEWAWSLPAHYKVRGAVGKRVLREVLKRYVPPAMFERPKQGFGFPVAIWLRGPLRDWAEALLDETRLRAEGYINPVPIRAAWARHLSGEANMSFALWGILMFQSWLDQNYRKCLALRETGTVAHATAT
jgi:asparagine synthase (glutamine-hydrolysing)